MKIGEFIERVNNGESGPKIAESLGLHRTTMTNIMNRLGFANKSRKWYWEGEGEPPLNDNILDHVGIKTNTRSAPKKKAIQNKYDRNTCISEINTEEIQKKEIAVSLEQKEIKTVFTEQETADLRAMLAEWKGRKGNGSNLTIRVAEIPKGDKIPKTYKLPSQLVNELDRIAEKEDMNKTDVLSLALLDFINKYKR